jgi:hypothetical protein
MGSRLPIQLVPASSPTHSRSCLTVTELAISLCNTAALPHAAADRDYPHLIAQLAMVPSTAAYGCLAKRGTKTYLEDVGNGKQREDVILDDAWTSHCADDSEARVWALPTPSLQLSLPSSSIYNIYRSRVFEKAAMKAYGLYLPRMSQESKAFLWKFGLKTPSYVLFTLIFLHLNLTIWEPRT